MKRNQIVLFTVIAIFSCFTAGCSDVNIKPKTATDRLLERFEQTLTKKSDDIPYYETRGCRFYAHFLKAFPDRHKILRDKPDQVKINQKSALFFKYFVRIGFYVHCYGMRQGSDD